MMRIVRRLLNLSGLNDKAMKRRSCSCEEPPFRFEDYKTVEVGEDSHGAEISVLTCNLCGHMWLNYLIDWPHQSRSGRWWRVHIPPDEKHSISTTTAREFIERSFEGFAGGSFFNSHGHRITTPITVA